VDVAVANDTDVLVLCEITPVALAGADAVGLGEAFPHRTGEALDGVGGADGVLAPRAERRDRARDQLPWLQMAVVHAR
jgi:hypothetical protein